MATKQLKLFYSKMGYWGHWLSDRGTYNV